jgi:hypothetical protein
MRLHARSVSIVACFIALVAPVTVAPALAQDKPRLGGELVFVVAAEPPSCDAHRATVWLGE